MPLQSALIDSFREEVGAVDLGPGTYIISVSVRLAASALGVTDPLQFQCDLSIAGRRLTHAAADVPVDGTGAAITNATLSWNGMLTVVDAPTTATVECYQISNADHTFVTEGEMVVLEFDEVTP